MKIRLPNRFLQAEMASVVFPAVQLYKDALWANVDAGRGLLLAGSNGVGKTWALAALTKAYVSTTTRKIDYEFLNSAHMFDCYPLFEDSRDDKRDSYRNKPWSTVIETVPWLVIDDLGKELRTGKSGEYVVYKLGRILRARSQNMLVTHISTNFDKANLQSAYGSSISSLLEECVDYHAVGGTDRRAAK